MTYPQGCLFSRAEVPKEGGGLGLLEPKGELKSKRLELVMAYELSEKEAPMMKHL